MSQDRKSTRLNSSHTVIYTLSLHDALPISQMIGPWIGRRPVWLPPSPFCRNPIRIPPPPKPHEPRSEEHTSELQSHSDLHSFPTRRSSDLSNDRPLDRSTACLASSVAFLS